MISIKRKPNRHDVDLALVDKGHGNGVLLVKALKIVLWFLAPFMALACRLLWAWLAR